MHRYGMEWRGWIARNGFWPLALLWLPAGVAAQAAVRFPPDAGLPGDPVPWPAVLTAAGSLLPAVTVAASLVAGLLGPVAVAVYAVVLSLPVWGAWWWLARRG